MHFRSQTVALTVIVDYVCLSFSFLAVICTIDNCDCICYNAVGSE